MHGYILQHHSLWVCWCVRTWVCGCRWVGPQGLCWEVHRQVVCKAWITESATGGMHRYGYPACCTPVLLMSSCGIPSYRCSWESPFAVNELVIELWPGMPISSYSHYTICKRIYTSCIWHTVTIVIYIKYCNAVLNFNHTAHSLAMRVAIACSM